MKILFFALHWGYLRPYVSVLEELARRGHSIHIAGDVEESFGNRPLVERLAAEHDGMTFGWTPERPKNLLRRFKHDLRHGINYLRYQEAMYRRATALKGSGAYRTPKFVRWLAARIPRQALESFLRHLERALPVDRTLRDYVHGQSPDMVLITPLLGISEDQFDELRAATELGIRTAFCVAGWDNLSTMAYIRFLPDRVLVWNETQRMEALEMHGVPEERVIVTGAQSMDKWFDRVPERSRQEFCARVGLPDDGPYILYMCSALLHGSPSEAELVQDWHRALRESQDDRLAGMSILVRPHPQRMKQWEGVDAARLDGAALWGRNPIDDESQDDYFDSMYHAEIVVGLSSTAMVEAATLGKPVATVMLERFRANQEEMPHFSYLTTVAGGLLHVTEDLDSHAHQLAELLQKGEVPDPRSSRFTREFVRPRGLDLPATDVFIDQLDALAAAESPEPERPRASDLLIRWTVAYPLATAYRIVELAAPAFKLLDRLVRGVLRRIPRARKAARMGLHRARKTVLSWGRRVRMIVMRPGEPRP